MKRTINIKSLLIKVSIEKSVIRDIFLTFVCSLVCCINIGEAKTIDLKIDQNVFSDSVGLLASQNPTIYLTGKAKKQAVCLRWAVSSSPAWQIALRRGYVIEKYSFKKNDTTTVISNEGVIHIAPFRGKDSSLLAKAALQEDYVAVYAEAVYGEKPELNLKGISPWLKLAEEIEMEQMRFSIANLACDRSFRAACIVGMGYIDTNVKQDCFYLYRLCLDTLIFGNRKDTALFFTDMSTYKELPPLQALQTHFADHCATLSWDIHFFDKICSGYYVERTLDGSGFRNKFVRLHSTPIMVLKQGEKKSNMLHYIDSLPDNQTKYIYRVMGVDIFGDVFQISEESGGRGEDRAYEKPFIESIQTKSSEMVEITWRFPKNKESLLQKYRIYVKKSMYADFEILEDNISPKVRTYTVKAASLPFSSYWLVQGVGKNGEFLESGTSFYEKKDTTPPLTVHNLKYKADTLGLVCLSWDRSLEEDIDGYRVFKSMGEDFNYMQITVDKIKDTCFFDTLSLRIRKPVFYKIIAIDKIGNESDFSLPISVKLPLPNPPVAAIFSLCRKEKEKLIITWYNSQDSDTKGHALYMRVDSSNWILLKDFPFFNGKTVAISDSFIFSIPVRNYATTYAFNIVAYTTSPTEDTIHAPYWYKFKYKPSSFLPRLEAYPNREKGYMLLQWNGKNLHYAKTIYLYRKENKGALRLLVTLNREEFKKECYADFMVKMNTVYDYVMQIEYEDQIWSEFSKKCSVMY
ncbi:MAG: hypothetical protein RRX93_00325 [Bacteroidales bacterium]